MFALSSDEVSMVTVEVKDAMESWSACVAFARLDIAAAVSLWMSVMFLTGTPRNMLFGKTLRVPRGR